MTDDGTQHVRFRWLVDLADGVLTGARERAAREHLGGGCAACEAESAQIAQLTAVLRSGPLEPPPPAALRRASRLFTQHRSRAALEAVGGAIARLVFDQRLTTAPALRSGGGARQLLWNVGESVELFASLTTGPDGVTLRGQFLPQEDDGAAASGGEIVIWSGEREVARVAIDANGEFEVCGLRPGPHTAEGAVGDLAFAVPTFVVD